MKTKFIVPFLLAAILSACASTDNGAKSAANDPDEKVYVTGSFLSHKPTDPNVGVISGDGVTDMQGTIGDHGRPMGAH